ncbi:MAG TPA: HlyD family efflux transporter periplasmic adaptor subunit [Steroidobacteraceae bacterium]|nr:HlyD family efflux transporter periplasmic adaptor subunit [Steroidobacteraceae bacterium]
MTRRSIAGLACLALSAAMALTLLLTRARADGGGDSNSKESVLVTLTSLKEGSLPSVVIGYGTVGAANSGRKTLMAPAAAVVARIFVRLGEQVPAGAPLLELAPSPASAAAYMQAKSALNVARQLVASTERLASLHLATAQQVADARKSESDARSQLRALDTVGAGGPKIVRAPFAAIVTALAATSGAMVAEGAPLMDLAAPGRLVLTVGVVPAQAGGINPGDQAQVTLVGSDQPVAASVLLRGAVAESDTGLVPVEVALPAGKFLPGEMAEAAITTGERRGYVVPHSAILVNDDGHPYVVQAVNGVAHKVPVQVLDARGDQDVITGAVNARAPLVLTGNYQLDDGMRIRLADPQQRGSAR